MGSPLGNTENLGRSQAAQSPAVPTVSRGLATNLGLSGIAIAIVGGAVSIFIEGDHSEDTRKAFTAAVVLAVVTIGGRMVQAAAAYIAAAIERRLTPKEVVVATPFVKVDGKFIRADGRAIGGAVARAANFPGVPGNPITVDPQSPGTQEKPYPGSTPPGIDGDPDEVQTELPELPEEEGIAWEGCLGATPMSEEAIADEPDDAGNGALGGPDDPFEIEDIDLRHEMADLHDAEAREVTA